MNSKINHFVCTNISYFYYTTEYFFKSMAEAGFNRIELYLGTPHIFIDDQVIDDFCNICQLKEKYQIKIDAVHPETLSFRYGLCYLDEKWNESSVKTYKHCIDFAERLGITRLHTNITIGFLDQNKEIIFRQLCDNLKQLSAYGRKKGVSIAVEAESSEFEGFICKLNQMQELKSEVGSDQLLVNVNYDAIKATGEKLANWMETFGNEIKYIRFSRPEDYLQIRKDLEAYEFSGDVIFSLLDDEYLDNPSKAVQQLRRIAVDGEGGC